MDRTEIVNDTRPEHIEFEALAGAGQLTGAAHEAWHPRTKVALRRSIKAVLILPGSSCEIPMSA